MYLLEPDEGKDGSIKVKLTIGLAHVRNLVLARDNSTCFALMSNTE